MMQWTFLYLACAVVGTVTADNLGSSRASLHRLFDRQDAPDANRTYPTMDMVGPPPLQAWVDKYNQVKSQIPTIPVATGTDGLANYPPGTDPSSPAVCQWSSNCNSTTDINDAPSGILALSFDDGPQEGTQLLLKFLVSQNMTATHFVIGSRILENTDDFKAMIAAGHDVAVHTWSHPMLTTLTDQQLLGEIGWTMQIIYDLTGKLPAFMRPPYGNTDNRVRAVCKYVFSLETVIWNEDTDDWCLNAQGGSSCSPGNGPQMDADLDHEMQTFLHGPKTPGLVILEHELTNRSSGGFIRAYPLALSLGWKPVSLIPALGYHWFQNFVSGGDPIVGGQGLLLANSSGNIGGSKASNGTVSSSSSSPQLAGQSSNSSSSSSSSASASRPSSSSRTSGTNRVIVSSQEWICVALLMVVTRLLSSLT